MELRVLDLFSGAGGFSKGIEMAGHKITEHYFSEIDKHAIANYLYNFKNAKYYGSVTDVRGKRGEVDIITFGSPCQDFSLAGKRKGMEGERSSLIGEAIRLIDEIRPSLFVWENVKGTFSSNNGADFWAIISSFANIGGYRLEWQLLNTSWFLPQNRERIYLIGHLAERSEPGVFPIGETSKKINVNKSKTNQICPTIDLQISKMSNDSVYVKVGDKNNNTIQINNCSSSGSGGNTDKYVSGINIRRLTEIECERLQGFPDNWTKYGIYNNEVKEIPKTQRYKLMGNAVTTEVVAEIFRRIKLKEWQH